MKERNGKKLATETE